MVQLNEVIEKLNLLFSMGDYETAETLIESARKVPALYNDTVAIFDANLSMNKGDRTQMWQAIRRGLECNPKNYELYVMLGEYYLDTNPNQAYLCYENALFYCDNENDKLQINELIDSLKKEKEITVNNTSFIILSYNTLDYTKTCIESIRENTPASSREIVIVDNNSTDGSLEWLKEQKDIVLRANKENSGFPKGCNQGVEMAQKENDIFLFNNDTLLPPNALFWLRMGLYENDSVGSTGSITNYASNLQSVPFEDPSTENMLDYALKTNLPMEYPYEEKLYLVGFALLIKRSVYDEVGDLDERFSPGNYEDNDYGLRVLQAGYKNILCHNSFILHFGSKSFGKKAEKYIDILSINGRKFEEKWKISPTSIYPRVELLNSINENRNSDIKILDVGCKCGATCAYFKSQFPNALVYGVESAENTFHIAKHVTTVENTDIEKLEFKTEEQFFDYIIIEEEFEKYKNPLAVLEKLYAQLKKGGHIIFITSNVKHYSVVLPLVLSDEFCYRDSGILNNEHARLYTRTSILQMLQQTSYKIESIHALQSPKPSEQIEKVIDTLVALSPAKDKDSYLTYQYIFIAQK